MDSSLIKVGTLISEKIQAILNRIFEDDVICNNEKVNRNTLRDSNLRKNIQYLEPYFEGNDLIIDTIFSHYIVYLEWTRPPRYGKMPPISALRDWAIANGIDDDNSTLFLIARAIWRDGHEGRPILSVLFNDVADELEKYNVFENLFNVILTDITAFFDGTTKINIL